MPPPPPPRQPIYLADDGVIRFRANAIVRRLVDERLIDLNAIALWRDIPAEDREQFWQMMGYSTSGFGDLSFVRPEVVDSVDEEARVLFRRQRATPAPSAVPTPPAQEPEPSPSAWERLGEDL